MRVAAIDCGTNTIKLLVLDEQGADLEREMRIVRLGQDVDRTGRLADEALARTFAAVEEYAAMVARHGVDRIRFCATSATRDSANAALKIAQEELSQMTLTAPFSGVAASVPVRNHQVVAAGIRRPDAP